MMPFNKLVSPSLTDLFVSEIQRMILSGELTAGERLPTEQQLSDQMGVSRAVVYNGVKKLEKLGFLRIAPRKGVYVTDYLLEGNLDTLQAILSYSGEYFTPEILTPILIFRRSTEGEIVRLSACHRTEGHLKTLSDLLDCMSTTSDSTENAALIYKFYHQLGLSTGNLVYPLLVSSFKPIYLSLLGVLLQLTDQRTCISYLQSLLQAIQAGDAQKADAENIRFIDYGEELILKRYKPGERYDQR